MSGYHPIKADFSELENEIERLRKENARLRKVITHAIDMGFNPFEHGNGLGIKGRGE